MSPRNQNWRNRALQGSLQTKHPAGWLDRHMPGLAWGQRVRQGGTRAGVGGHATGRQQSPGDGHRVLSLTGHQLGSGCKRPGSQWWRTHLYHPKICKQGDVRFWQGEVEAVAGRASRKKHKLLPTRKLPSSNAQLLPRRSPDQLGAAGRSLWTRSPCWTAPDPAQCSGCWRNPQV